MRDGRVPDLRALARHIFEIRVGASLRGLEATVEGIVAKDGDALLLRSSQAGEAFRLTPLERKIQWDPTTSREETSSADERSAFAKIEALSTRSPVRARVTGPVRDGAAGEARAVEVRSFVIEG